MPRHTRYTAAEPAPEAMTERRMATPGKTARARGTATSAVEKIALTHAEWQQQVIDLAHLLGYKHLHVRRTIGKGRKWVTSTNRTGWPDLFLWHPKRGGFVALELKAGKDKPTVEQLEVLAELEAAGARTMVAYPDDLEAVRLLLQR